MVNNKKLKNAHVHVAQPSLDNKQEAEVGHHVNLQQLRIAQPLKYCAVNQLTKDHTKSYQGTIQQNI
jgi:hypothetical protein